MKLVYIIYILTKIYFNTLIRIIKNTFITTFFRKKLETNFSTPIELKNESYFFQKEFAAIFKKYDECKNCVSHCCYSKTNRFDLIDCFLENYILMQGLSPWHQFPHLLSAIADLFHNISKSYDDKPPLENCIHFSTSSGCLLAIGNRPGMCIAGACYKLLSKFSSNDLREYSTLLSKYIVFRFRCFFYLIKQLHRLRNKKIKK